MMNQLGPEDDNNNELPMNQRYKYLCDQPSCRQTIVVFVVRAIVSIYYRVRYIFASLDLLTILLFFCGGTSLLTSLDLLTSLLLAWICWINLFCRILWVNPLNCVVELFELSC
jgi:hypothetical protein